MEVGRARGGSRMTGVVRDRRAKADEVTIKGGGGAGVFEERRKRRHSDGEKAPVKFRKSRSDVSRSRNTGGGGKGRVGSGEAASYAGDGEKNDEEEMETADVKEIDGNVVEGDEETLPIVPFVENVDSIATKPANVEEEGEEKLLLVPPIGNNPNRPNAEKKKLQQSSFGEEVTKLPSIPAPDYCVLETQSRFQNLGGNDLQLFNIHLLSFVSNLFVLFQYLLCVALFLSVNLFMWRDASRSSLAFGFGTFMLMSSAYMKELQFSFTSAVSYCGLICLAVRFMHQTLILRVSTDIRDSYHGCMISEVEAVRLVKVVLPYFNELLFNIRGFFSGDPATTMKVGVGLFVLARYGGSISMWTVARIAFFGLFTLPKIYHAYSSHMAAYMKFWMRRLKDAWDSCTHKKAVAAAIFTMVWNLSSLVVRLWTVFILVVAVKLCQESLLQEVEETGLVMQQEQTLGDEWRPTLVKEDKEKDIVNSRPHPGQRLFPLHTGNKGFSL